MGTKWKLRKIKYSDYLQKAWIQFTIEWKQAKDRVIYYIQVAQKFDTLYLALGHHKDRAGLSLEWEPILCYKKEDTFFHIIYRDSWMCRDCGNVLHAPIIMPMCEGDPDFYYGTKNRFPDIPPFFQKIPCSKCNSLLQNHLIILE